MIGSQTGDIRVYRLAQDIPELGRQYYADRSADGSHLAAWECNGNPGEAEVWIGTPLSLGKAGDPIAFQRGGRRPCLLTGGIGSVPMPLKLGAGGRLVLASLAGDRLVAQLLEPWTGDGRVPVELYFQAIQQEALPPSQGG
jgi:hypothetical protein